MRRRLAPSGLREGCKALHGRSIGTGYISKELPQVCSLGRQEQKHRPTARTFPPEHGIPQRLRLIRRAPPETDDNLPQTLAAQYASLDALALPVLLLRGVLAEEPLDDDVVVTPQEPPHYVAVARSRDHRPLGRAPVALPPERGMAHARQHREVEVAMYGRISVHQRAYPRIHHYLFLGGQFHLERGRVELRRRRAVIVDPVEGRAERRGRGRARAVELHVAAEGVAGGREALLQFLPRRRRRCERRLARRRRPLLLVRQRFGRDAARAVADVVRQPPLRSPVRGRSALAAAAAGHGFRRCQLDAQRPVRRGREEGRYRRLGTEEISTDGSLEDAPLLGRSRRSFDGGVCSHLLGRSVGDLAVYLRRESAELVAPRAPVHAHAALLAARGGAPFPRADHLLGRIATADRRQRRPRRLAAGARPLVYHLAEVVIRRRRLRPEYLVLHDQGEREEVLAYDLLRVAASPVEAAAAPGGGRFAAAVAVVVEEAMVVKPGFGGSHGQWMIIAGGIRRSCHCQ